LFHLYLAGVVFRHPPLLKIGSLVGFGTLGIQTAGILLRWVESYRLGYGHAPLSNLYESLVFASWTIMLIYLLLEHRAKQRVLGVFPTLIAFLAMAYASFSTQVDTRIQPLIPALKSNWLIAHVITCFLGYAGFAVSTGISIFYLLRKSRAANPHPRGILAVLPEPRQLDEFNYRMYFSVSSGCPSESSRVPSGPIRLGDPTGAGTQGDLVTHHMARICSSPTRALHAGLAWKTRGMAFCSGIRVCALHVLRGQFPIERSTQLRY